MSRSEIARAALTRCLEAGIRLGHRVLGFDFVEASLAWVPKHMIVSLLRSHGASIGENLSHKDNWLIDNAAGTFSNLCIGNDCYVGKSVHLDLPCQITIEDEAVISARVMILTHADVGDRVLSRWYARKEGPVRVGRGSWVGAGAILLPGVVLGEQCVVAAGAVVRTSWPPRSVIAGVPARLVKRLEECSATDCGNRSDQQ